MTITLRSAKGSPLTHAEADENIRDLDERTELGWRDNVVQVDVKHGDPNAPTLNVFRNGILAYTFFNGEMNEAFAYFHVDHDYALGTAMFPHLHWAVNTTAVGTVRWGVEYTIAKGHGQMAFAPTTTVYIEQATDGTAYKHYVAEVSVPDAIAGTYLEPDTLILVRFFRDGAHVNDTLDEDVFLFCVDLHYQANRQSTPNKSPSFYI